MKADKNTVKYSLVSRMFKPVKASKTEETSNSTQTKKPSKHSKKLINFVKSAIEQNMGDYADISSKLAVLNLFVEYAKTIDSRAHFDAIKTFYSDFFAGSDNINSFKTINNFIANYSKAGDERRSIKNVRGVSVATHEEQNCPVVYFGQRKVWAENFDKDTYLMFGGNSVLLYDYHMARYEEIPLEGDGTIAQFDFNEQNRLIGVQYRYLEHPRLGFWSGYKQINFESGYYLDGEKLLLDSKNTNQK